MKVYFAIMLALLMATAYGIKSKQDNIGTTTDVDTTTMNISNDTKVGKNTQRGFLE